MSSRRVLNSVQKVCQRYGSSPRLFEMTCGIKFKPAEGVATPLAIHPNQALEPTTPAVTIRADARLAPAGVVAHL